jgi:GT2 family glycosyltransferase
LRLIYAGAVPRCSLVIATRRRPQALAATLAALAGCDPLPAELIVVDGDEAGSAREVVDRFAATAPGLAVRHLPSPAGLTRQRNAGLARASEEIVVFADDDVVFDPGVFAALAGAYAEAGVVGATGRVIEPGERRVGTPGSPLRRLLTTGPEGTMTAFGYPRRIADAGTPRDVEFMHGCLMSARRDVALAVGFDEELPGYGLAEDEDFGYRLSRVGRVRYVPGASVVHLREGFRSSGRRAFDRMLVRNRAYLFRKNFRATPATRLGFAALLAVLAVHRALNREWAGLLGLAEGARDARRDRAQALVAARRP